MESNGPSTWRQRLSPLFYLANNWISRIGVVFVTSAAILWLFLLPTYLQGHSGSAYVGILLFLMLPTAFFAGLALIPLGIILRRRGKLGAIDPSIGRLELSWSNPALRRMALFVGMVTFVNIVIGSNLTYRAVEYMDSVQFCGQTCHVVMKPEFTAYQNSPHSRVECVKCHIGPGASWFVQSKLSGVHQVFAVAFNTYDKPIPTPIENLRPARETCEACHWPDKYGADRLRVITHFDDEGKQSKTVLLMRIGGGGLTGSGIHSAHVGQGITIRYRFSDDKRQEIPWVEYQKDGAVTQFKTEKAKQAELDRMPVRVMDCVDCHNRPSHTFERPERALDNALAAHEVASDLPGIRKRALEVLLKEYPSTEAAEREIPAGIIDYYRGKSEVFPARKADIDRSAKAVLAIWQRNVFPEMKVAWGTYFNNIGHTDYPGCFRCHDAEHSSKDGKVIEQDCNSCHVLLAMEEESPKILTDLGVQ